jgi:hypothetical protein
MLRVSLFWPNVSGRWARMSKRVKLAWRGPDGEPVFGPLAVSLLVGVDVEEVRKVLPDGCNDAEMADDGTLWLIEGGASGEA